MKLALDKLKLRDVVRNIKSCKKWEVITDYRYKDEGLDVMSIDGLGSTMRLTEKNIGRYELIYCDRWIYSKFRKDVDEFREVSCVDCPCIDVCKVVDYISEVFDEL